MKKNYAISRDINIAKTFEYDVVIVGAGVAGLYASLNLDSSMSCLVLAKESVNTSNSWLAQAGIAAAISGDDNPNSHLQDTLVAGAGLSDINAVQILAQEGPSDIKNLVSLGVPFDFNEFGELDLTIEGGHNKRRVVHAGGDATGRETVIALATIAARYKNIKSRGNSCLFDILTDSSSVVGVVIKCSNGDFHLIKTKNVVIATGGAGHVYKSTTNPSVATGDGIAAAARAGAKLRDIEFIQFHPTGLWLSDSEGRKFLISESLRGEGAILVNHDGKRFMLENNPRAELAPRDIVARGIFNEMLSGNKEYVFLDITSKSEDYLKSRFPTIYNECLKHGINISQDKIPVHPVQHYLMGGIMTDLDGQTNITGLYACGEAASTGIHGANRLAANSLLECLVFGRRTAKCINANAAKTTKIPSTEPQEIISNIPLKSHKSADYAKLRADVQELMSGHCGIIRKKSGIHFALEQINQIYAQLDMIFDNSIEYLEALNIATLAKKILEAANQRTASIGSHYMIEENGVLL